MGTSLKLINDMKHLFVPYDIALMAKEKGFNEECFGIYSGGSEFLHFNMYEQNSKIDLITDSKLTVCSAPLYQQLIDWFEEKKISIDLVHFDNWDNWVYRILCKDIMSAFFIEKDYI